MERIIEEVQPRFVFVENSPNLRTKGLLRVIEGLFRLGYNTRRGVFGCRALGADHHRKRMFILADSDKSQFQGGGLSCGIHSENSDFGSADWWKDQPGLERVADGMANQMDRLKAIGNGQVPAVVRLAWNTLMQK
jgi:DNA (cytosine-5)-methyltransferase 1